MSDTATTTQAQDNKLGSISVWFANRYEELKLLSKTAIALVIILNSTVLGLMAMDFVEPNRITGLVLGSISMALAAVVLGTFVHQGVKFQSTSKRKK